MFYLVIYRVFQALAVLDLVAEAKVGVDQVCYKLKFFLSSNYIHK